VDIDVGLARRDTPGCEQVLHLNNAGASLPPRQVLDATIAHLHLEAEIGGYEAAARAEGAVERVYDAAAALLGCARDEIAFTDSATRAWCAAFYAMRFEPGDRILLSRAEYGANAIAAWQVARRTGARVEVVPDDAHGQLSVDALRQMLDERVRLIAVTHAPTQGGLVNPAAEIGKAAREAGVPFLLDACQSAGQLPLDVSELGCDLLTLTGRKWLRAPRGTGLLYARRELAEQLEPAMLDLHSAEWVAPDRVEIRPDARRFETWETNVAAKIGLGVAIDYALGWGLDAIWARVRELGATLRAGLASLAEVTVHDLGQVKSGIVTFTVAGQSAGAIRSALAAEGVNVSVSSASSARYDLDHRGLPELVRASVHYYNTADEIERFCSAVSRLAGAAPGARQADG
jgi:cysteine desulfurase / selenocysteine lyase